MIPNRKLMFVMTLTVIVVSFSIMSWLGLDGTEPHQASPSVIDWAPCNTDPNRDKLIHCSEQYRICRKVGNSVGDCLARDYSDLEVAKEPSIDEWKGCAAAGYTESECTMILTK